MEINKLAFRVANSVRMNNILDQAEIDGADLKYQDLLKYDDGDKVITVEEFAKYLRGQSSLKIADVESGTLYKVKNSKVEPASEEETNKYKQTKVRRKYPPGTSTT